MIKKFNDYIKEDAITTAVVGSGTAVGGGDSGTSYATNSNTSGMGAIISPQPSNIPGDVAGSTKGSGDIAKSIGTFTKTPSFKNIRKKRKEKKKDSYKNKTIDELMVTSIKKFESFDND